MFYFFVLLQIKPEKEQGHNNFLKIKIKDLIFEINNQ